MFNIPDDKQAQKSADLIAQGLWVRQLFELSRVGIKQKPLIEWLMNCLERITLFDTIVTL